MCECLSFSVTSFAVIINNYCFFFGNLFSLIFIQILQLSKLNNMMRVFSSFVTCVFLELTLVLFSRSLFSLFILGFVLICSLLNLLPISFGLLRLSLKRFGFGVSLFVCVSVLLCLLVFFVQDFSGVGFLFLCSQGT